MSVYGGVFDTEVAEQDLAPFLKIHSYSTGKSS